MDKYYLKICNDIGKCKRKIKDYEIEIYYWKEYKRILEEIKKDLENKGR